MNLNSSSPFPVHPISDNHCNHDHHQHLHPIPNSSSISCHIFFNSTAQDHMGFYDHHQLYPPQHQPDDNYAYNGGSTYEIKNKVESGIKLSLWKKDDYEQESTPPAQKGNNPVKWMSSKMRLMQKMKNPDCVPLNNTEDNQTLQSSSSLETDLSSNSSLNNNNSPLVRVCADCNTTKTPLWRSGPKGPKSLCNACGIRQRKARRAMAAAASGTADQPVPATKIKLQHKEKTTKHGLKKRCKTTTSASTSTAGSASNGEKKIGFEDFLINLSKNLAFHRVFPEDEKDAAILLMALSSGLIHG